MTWELTDDELEMMYAEQAMAEREDVSRLARMGESAEGSPRQIPSLPAGRGDRSRSATEVAAMANSPRPLSPVYEERGGAI